MCGVRGGSRRHAREFPASCPAPTGHLLAASTQNRPPVHSACQRGSKNGQNRKKPCRVDAKSASCAFCLSTRQQKRAKSPKTLPRRRKIGLLCILFVNAAAKTGKIAKNLAASTQNRPSVHSTCQRGKRREGENSLRGDSGRFAPSGPSHNLLRPRFAGTCILRAPPPALVRGWTSPPEGVSPFPASPTRSYSITRQRLIWASGRWNSFRSWAAIRRFCVSVSW